MLHKAAGVKGGIISIAVPVVVVVPKLIAEKSYGNLESEVPIFSNPVIGVKGDVLEF